MKNIDIRIVSLADADERRKKISRNFNNVGLDFNFCDAVDGKLMQACDYYKLCKNPNFLFNRRFVISPSELGCRLSHSKAINDFLNSCDKEWLFLGEDDISFDDHFVHFLNFLDNSFFEENILIHCGGLDGLSNSKRLVLSKQNEILYMGVKVVNKYTLRWLYRTCGYLINRNMAMKLNELHARFTFIADDWGFVRKKCNLKKIYFLNVIQHPVDLRTSTIERERVSG